MKRGTIAPVASALFNGRGSSSASEDGRHDVFPRCVVIARHPPLHLGEHGLADFIFLGRDQRTVRSSEDAATLPTNARPLEFDSLDPYF